jgi:hypothetical protein
MSAFTSANVKVCGRGPGARRAAVSRGPASHVRSPGDSVAKVVLQKVRKILRAPGAVFVWRSEGPHRLTLNS